GLSLGLSGSQFRRHRRPRLTREVLTSSPTVLPAEVHDGAPYVALPVDRALAPAALTSHRVSLQSPWRAPPAEQTLESSSSSARGVHGIGCTLAALGGVPRRTVPTGGLLPAVPRGAPHARPGGRWTLLLRCACQPWLDRRPPPALLHPADASEPVRIRP